MKLRILLPSAATLASPTGYNCKHTCFLSKQNIVERKKTDKNISLETSIFQILLESR